MTIIRKAAKKDIQVLSGKLLMLLEDKNSQIFRENVARFGIPEEYVRTAFAEETLLRAAAEGATFYLALENDEIIGFAQTVQKDANTSELDRIIVFPRYTRRGIGTQLLKQAIADQEQKGINNVIVDIGKEEIQARGFYEKDGFKQTEEATIEAPVGQKNNSSYLPASFGAWVILELPLAAAMQRNS